MSNMVLQCKEGGDFKPHPEGIHPAICLDVIDLGLVETEFQGERRMAPKVKVVFESDKLMEDGRPFVISKNFTASLHPKAKLAEFLGKWRGRPVLPGESIDLARLIGACCTLVVSHQQNLVGRTYASIDAVSKPTRKLAASGAYDPAAARQRIEDWKAKQAAGQAAQLAARYPVATAQIRAGRSGPGPAAQGPGQPVPHPSNLQPSAWPGPATAPGAAPGVARSAAEAAQMSAMAAPPKSGAPAAARTAADDIPFDPEVGF